VGLGDDFYGIIIGTQDKLLLMFQCPVGLGDDFYPPRF